MAVLPLSLLDAPLVSVWKSYVASFLNVHATCWGDNNTSSAFYGWELKNIMSYGGQLSLDYQVFACETRSTESVTPQQDVSLASSTMATSVRQKLTAKQSHAAEGGPVETEIRTANWDIINHQILAFEHFELMETSAMQRTQARWAVFSWYTPIRHNFMTTCLIISKKAAWIRHIKHEPPKSFMFLETSLSDEHLLLHHQAPSACTQYSPLLAPPPLLSVCPRHWLAVRELPASPSPPPAACGWCGPRATGCRPLRRFRASSLHILTCTGRVYCVMLNV